MAANCRLKEKHHSPLKTTLSEDLFKKVQLYCTRLSICVLFSITLIYNILFINTKYKRSTYGRWLNSVAVQHEEPLTRAFVVDEHHINRTGFLYPQSSPFGPSFRLPPRLRAEVSIFFGNYFSTI